MQRHLLVIPYIPPQKQIYNTAYGKFHPGDGSCTAQTDTVPRCKSEAAPNKVNQDKMVVQYQQMCNSMEAQVNEIKSQIDVLKFQNFIVTF